MLRCQWTSLAFVVAAAHWVVLASALWIRIVRLSPFCHNGHVWAVRLAPRPLPVPPCSLQEVQSIPEDAWAQLLAALKNSQLKDLK